ncbi:uncharacterized protein BDZ83DRAFT_632424 [Colletotrichum acutatum]|uniref:Secreted protein n=1 Tax=Glomerella acutata TaxID=27357 RepID=A0AAD8UGZ0_GLOAC|nr:uncharacterized protein BDZ83DRAFT_632424 [Colletotrichum acutatum]KAK1718856.1 hypothetical protein BDZ83DRAFT_632424 [Colletotrichum acutatum]
MTTFIRMVLGLLQVVTNLGYTVSQSLAGLFKISITETTMDLAITSKQPHTIWKLGTFDQPPRFKMSSPHQA